MKRGICAKILKTQEDKLSQLPDELLIFVVSLIPCKEAARTSVLSRRWKKVWTFIPVLNLDASSTLSYLLELQNYERRREMVTLERSKYVNYVNSVLNLFQGSTMEEFRIRFDLNFDNSHDIQRWVKFSLEKKVQRLVMDLGRYNGMRPYKRCVLDVLSTPPCNTIQMFHERTLGVRVCSSLRVVQLTNVKISEDFFDYLSTCSSLEHLSLRYSNLPVNLKVDNPLLSLKYLDITYCIDVKSIDLCAPNLLSFRYYGRGHLMNISFEKIPRMTKLYIGSCYADYILFENPSTFTNYFTRLETLSLNLNLIIKKEAKLVKIPVLPHLKNLELDVCHLCDGHNLLMFTPLIKSSPLLERFRMKLTIADKFWMKLTIAEPKSWSKKKCPNSPHNNLKLVEIIGFRGCAIDDEFITYLIENAIMLEKVIIDPRQPSKLPRYAIGNQLECTYMDKIRIARENAKQLECRFCLGDKLLVL